MPTPPVPRNPSAKKASAVVPVVERAVAPVPPAPRVLSRLALRRSWFLPQVRPWWLMAAGVLAVAVGVAIVQYQEWRQEAQLIRTGMRVSGRFMGMPNTSRLPGKAGFPGQVVEFELQQNGKVMTRPSGGPFIVTCRLTVQDKGLVTGSVYPIIVDPANWDNFTLRTEARPVVLEMMGALTLAPLILVLIFICLWKRRRVLRIWSDGEAHEAVVINSVRAGAAPDSRLVRCTLKYGNDQRILRVLVPRSVPAQPGDVLWLLTPSNAVEPALPLAAFPR